MADYSKNITNAVNVFGGGPSSKWGDANGYPYTFTWGTTTWGEGGSLPLSFQKVISNNIPTTFDYYAAQYTKRSDLGSVVGDFTATSQTLRQGSWYYVFTSDTYLGSERDFASWTSGTRADATFTCLPTNVTSWSSGR